MTTLAPAGEVQEKPTTQAARARSPYIAAPWYDWAFFLLPPLASLVIGALIAGTSFSDRQFWLGGRRTTWESLLLGSFINAHLVAVFVRSHLNPDVFRRHRIRFVVVPILAFVAMMVSMWAVVLVTALVVLWDVYHSALQTFGLARIYDRNLGNDPSRGRRLDLALNVLLYAGPIAAGATLLPHLDKTGLFGEDDGLFSTEILARLLAHQGTIAWVLITGGTAFVAYYVIAYARLHRQGYRISPHKVFLLATTGLCSVWVWGKNPWGQAFFIMNVFHAVQYLALVWWSERGVLLRRMRLEKARVGPPLALFLFLGLTSAYGLWAEIATDDSRALWSLVQVVALMHFFYDGFIWSVRKRQI